MILYALSLDITYVTIVPAALFLHVNWTVGRSECKASIVMYWDSCISNTAHLTMRTQYKYTLFPKKAMAYQTSLA